jgi:glycosyltransferase involved in cell wall biosynthesis
MAELVELQVVAPVPLVDYSHLRGRVKAASPGPRSRQDGRLTVYHPRWWYPPLGGALNALFLAVRLFWTVLLLRRGFRFDVIDAHFGHPEGVAAALLAMLFRVPFVVTLRGNELSHSTHFFRRHTIAWALARATRVIAVSENLRRFALSMGVDSGRVVTIPNGVDATLFHPRDRQDCRRKHGIPPEARVILSAGSLTRLKGHHRIVRALGILDVPALLLIAGSEGRAGGYQAEIRRAAEQLHLESRVRFLGQLAPGELAEFMAAADVFCLASSREGWPNVVHEALACGTPVVASNVGGIPDLLPDRQLGIILEDREPGTVARALDIALRQDWNRKSISDQACARSWDHVAAEAVGQLQAEAG